MTLAIRLSSLAQPRKLTKLAAACLIATLVGCESNHSTEVYQLQASGITLSAMDTSVRPQDDFFRFVNGQWLDNTEIPSDRSSYGTFSVLRDQSEKDVKAILEDLVANGSTDLNTEEGKVRALYSSFLDLETVNALGAEPYLKIAKDIDAINSKQALLNYITQPWMMGEISPIGIYVDSDKSDPTRYAPYLYQSGLSLPDRDYYFDESEKGQGILEAYQAHVSKMLELAGFTAPQASAERVIAFESKLAEGHWTKVESRDAVKTYNPTALTALSSEYKGFDWPKLLANTGIKNTDNLVVIQPSYLSHFIDTFETASLEEWKLYLKWRTLTHISSYLSEPFADENFNFFGKTLYGTEEQRPRWKRAVAFTGQTLGEAIGKIYVKEHFPPEAKTRMITLVENLREAYRESILQLDWMTDETKEQAIKKLNKFRPKIGYPDEWKDYSSLKVSNNLVENYISANNFDFMDGISKLGGPINPNEWFISPQTVNAYYHPIKNEIVFPAAILQPPFFDLEADDAINYGAIGGVIGHEMGHGFDDQGSRYNGDGALENWWSETDAEAFKERTALLVSQYNAYEPLEGLHVNGELTLGENIGDLGGLTIAHKAYELSLNGKTPPEIDGFTGEQRFFIGWAQAFRGKYTDQSLTVLVKTNPHSPYQYRVNGVVKNMPEFDEAFGVEKDDGLFLPKEEQVKIW